MKNLKIEGHIFSEADEIFVGLTPKIVPTRREKEQRKK